LGKYFFRRRGDSHPLSYLVYFDNKETKQILIGLSYFFACTVCFGDPESLLSKGVATGVLFLLGLILVVLGTIAATSLVWARRAKRLNNTTSRAA
jgi:hypothetical protein